MGFHASLSFYTSAGLKQGKSSLDGKATPWKLLSAFLDFTLSGKSCSGTCVGYPPEDRRDDFLIFLVLYLRRTTLMSSGEMFSTEAKMINWTIHANPL